MKNFYTLVCPLMLLFLLPLGIVYGQVGINTTTPADGSILDVTSSNKGVLIPRVNIADLNTIDPIIGGSPAGLLVFNTNSTTGEGFYFWDGSSWILISTGTNDDWRKSGNAGTNPSNDFIGSTDNASLRFRTNNVERFVINTSGQLQSYGNGSSSEPSFSWNSSNSTGIFSPDLNEIAFSTNSTERMRFDSSGAVGIGTTTPTTNNGVDIDRLNVVGQGTSSGSNFTPMSIFENTGDGASLAVFNTDDGNNDFPALEVGTNNSDGTAIRGINTNGDDTGPAIGVFGATNSFSSGWAGLFNGDIGASAYFTVSDERLKTEIKDIEDGILDKVMKLAPKTYKWDKSRFPGLGYDATSSNLGFIAQELEEVFPEMVDTKYFPGLEDKVQPLSSDVESSKFHVVDYAALIPVLTKAIQEQQELIEKQNERISQLENRLNQLDKR